MGLFKRLFGISDTRLPADSGCWKWEGGAVEVELGRAQELSAPGGAIRLEGGGLPRRVLIVHGTDGAFHAFENRCTHRKRRIGPVPGEGRLCCCSVGKSTFGHDGRRVSGPARKPLPVLEVKKQGDRLVIRLD